MSVPSTAEAQRHRVLPGKPESFWIDTTADTHFPPIRNEVRVDVAVLGGGIAGLTAAALLRRAGLNVAVVEAGRVIKRVSGCTTAMVTSAHGIIYRYLITHFGKDGAQIYADANQAAIEQIADFIQQQNIYCDFKRASAYTFIESGSVDELRDEFEASKSLKLPVSYTQDVPLPFRTKAAIRFGAQAQFHPRKYLLSLLESIPGKDSYIFENTRALEIKEGDPCQVITDMGALQADHVIVATHFPFVNDGGYYMKMIPKQSYVLGVLLRGALPEGMFYNPGESFNTIRSHPHLGGEMLLLGGEENKTGQGGDIIGNYSRLEEYARSHFDVRSVDYHWTTQDNVTMDMVPYVGRLSAQYEKVFVATGFCGWGMTGGTVAGMILADQILEKTNPWAAFYNSLRVRPLTAARQFLSISGEGGKGLVSGRVPAPSSDIESLPSGEGRIVEINKEKVGVYRDMQGKLHAVSTVCTHMGCTLTWDNAEKSWDCPCHGSRFNYRGQVIYGPAVTNLEKRKV
jgi:glycine/D-amino acid oxidase-like deaminating enzyme/nitrite reductase/ring-hydroxylating ferredoxin subunit